VDAQGGAYATGVLVIMTSAAFAVMLSALWNDNSLRATLAFGLVTLIFLYTLVANILERPDGIKIASFFIASIIVVSLASRVRRSLELRQERIEIDEKAKKFIVEASKGTRSTSSPTAVVSPTIPKSTPGS
jgi:K+ transporter